MGKSAIDPQVPGAPVGTAEQADKPSTAAKTEAPSDDKDAEIARLRALLATQAGGMPIDSMVIEPVTQHGAAHLAESKHKHLTSTELDKQVRSGAVKLVDHHVLCKDGWYANPNWSANGG